jgi:hypothetical protein
MEQAAAAGMTAGPRNQQNVAVLARVHAGETTPMSIADQTARAFPFVSAIKPMPVRRMGRPPNPLPPGLSDDTITKLRRRAEKMARANNASFPVIFFAKILASLSEQGFANLNMRQVLTLAKQAADMPDELAVAVAAFLAAHPPSGADHAIMQEAMRRGCVCGVDGLIQLHRHIADRQRKARAKRKAATPPNPNRPKLLTQKEKQQRADAERKQAEAEQAERALDALERLYPIRHRLLPWQIEFLECCEALRKSGFGMVPWQAEQMLELEQEQQAA